jgi:putative ABC transport system ATP-binding protein
LVLENVTKSYDGGLVDALKGISLAVAAGEVVAIMGHSGCGKSTLLNLIGALDRPTSGSVRFQGREVGEHAPLHRFRATHIGFVFQFHHLLPHLTLLENVEMPMYLLPLSRGDRRRKAQALLDAVGLSHRARFRPTRVSGGERQRAAVARALVNAPSLVLADEPTGNLDTDTGNALVDFMIHYCGERRVTLMIATHNGEIAAKGDRVIHMQNGAITAVRRTSPA